MKRHKMFKNYTYEIMFNKIFVDWVKSAFFIIYKI